jgi:hypothetical protein
VPDISEMYKVVRMKNEDFGIDGYDPIKNYNDPVRQAKERVNPSYTISIHHIRLLISSRNSTRTRKHSKAKKTKEESLSEAIS